jgi:dUTPase
LASDNPKIRYSLNPESKYLPKICDQSNGIDVPLQEEITLQPNEIRKVKLGIRFLIPIKYCGLLMNKSSALIKYKIKVTLGLIDYGFNGELQTVLENSSNSITHVKAGTALCQLLVLPAETPMLDNKWKEPENTRGSFGSTGQSFLKKEINPKIKNYLRKNKNKTKFTIQEMENKNHSTTQLNLIKMAEDSQISATSFSITMGSQSHTLKCFTISNPNLRKGLDKKVYLPMYINNNRVIACSDSGSDLTLMQESLFHKLIGRKRLQESQVREVKSYSDTVIQVRGEVQVSVKFNLQAPLITLTIVVIKDIPGSITPFLFGNDSFKTCLATLAYTGDVNNPQPEFIINNPILQIVNLIYASPSEIMTCTAEYVLKPYETANIEFKLHPAAPVTRTDEVIISSTEWDDIHVLPSKSDIQYNHLLNCYQATACVVNLTNHIIKGTSTVEWEPIYNYRSHVINEESKPKLLDLMSKRPPVRQILPEKLSNQISIPRITVNKIDLVTDEIKETDMSQVLGGQKVSYTGTAEISNQIIDAGLEIPTIIHGSPEEALNLNLFEPEVRPYIKRIFLEKYRSVVSLHSLDAGDVSKTLGFTALRLIPGEKLPRHKRIYQLSPQDVSYLEELLENFIRFNYVRRAPIETTDLHLYGMSTYLIPRRKTSELPRLIIDFSPLTSIIQSPPSVVPDIAASLQNLQGKALYSSMDLRYAYLALRIDEASKPLTTFLTPTGAYQWLSLPTGAACSPAFFIDAVNRILHYKPVRDHNGKPVYEGNKVKLTRDILKFCFHYFDDIICSSEVRKTYKEALDYHFDCLEKIVERLAFHNVKLSVNKSEFAKSKILFLGWIISHDFVIPDPRRIEKIKDAKFPTSKKEVRSFLGLVNSIRRVIPFDVIKQMQILTPLTSSSKNVPFEINNEHTKAFETIKGKLLQEPLFCNLIREDAVKYLWVDAASSSGCLGAVLAQQIANTKDPKLLPTCINLDDPVHRIIFDKGLHYEPCRLYTKLPIVPPKPSELKTQPPYVKDLGPYKGFTFEEIDNSLFWSILSIYAVYGCKMPESINELRSLTVKEAKKGILGIKIKDQSFNNYHGKYRQYLDEFETGKHNLDKDWLMAEALAKATHRCIIFISTLPEHKNNPIIKFNVESTKPPLILGVYLVENKFLFTPFYFNKNLEFNSANLRNKVQIIAYLAKSVPEAFRSRSILDLEAFAILTALHSLQRYISNTKCHLLTDSRVLYYLFHQQVGDSSVKIRRWVLKLLSDYPLISLHFIRTTENLADYLTRQGLPKGDLDKLCLKDLKIKDFFCHLPKPDYTLSEWAQFCAENPHYLTVSAPTINSMTFAMDKGIQNITDITIPLEILKEKLSRENFITLQKAELTDIYEKCLENNNFEYITSAEKDVKQYRLNFDLLVINQNGFKILVPDSLIGPLLAYTHLLGHMGTIKMIKNISINYYFKNMYALCKKFCSSCYGCFLNHGSSRSNKLGNYPIPDYPFQEVSVDLAESLNTIKGYSHLMIVQDVLTDYLLVFPLKSKTSQEIGNIFLYSILQNYNIAKIHSDNATCFRQKDLLKLWAALNITVINSSAQNPSARGKAERAVGTVKLILKKMLATASSKTLNWEMLPFLITKIYNHTITPRTGFKPIEMIMGQGKNSVAFFEKETLTPVHHSIANVKQSVELLTNTIEKMTDIAKVNMNAIKIEMNNRENKNRINKLFNKGDIVYALDRYMLPGNTRPLKTKYYPSPCVVIKPMHTTTLIQRIADGFRALYSNNDIKKLRDTDENFKILPEQVQNILINDFKNMLDSDFKIITQHDELNIPEGVILYDTIDPEKPESISFPPLKGEGAPTTPSPEQNTTPKSENEVESDESDDENEGEPDTINLRSGKRTKQVRFRP